MRRLTTALAALVLLAAPAAARAQGADESMLRPGDAIRLSVFRLPEFTGEYPVGPGGNIQHPLLREVVVAGVPRAEIDRRIREVLLRYETDPRFVFDYLFRVSVGGEVRIPSLYTLSPETSIAQAIAAAGGVTERGRLDRVVLVRDGRETVLDLRSPDASPREIRVHSGDEIRVGRGFSPFGQILTPLASVVGAVAAVIAIFN